MPPKLYEEVEEFNDENPLDNWNDLEDDWLPENGWGDEDD